MKSILGTMWFQTTKDENDKLRTECIGVVESVNVRRPDGTVVTIAKDNETPARPEPLVWHDMTVLKVGDYVLHDGKTKAIERIFLTTGELWVRDPETGQTTEHKYFELRKHVPRGT